MKKYNILLTNDDGITAPGITALYNSLKNKYNVFVVAPNSEKSGTSHSITISSPLYAENFKNSEIEGVAVNGSPADCVKLALHNLHKDKIDLVLSGINMGSNNGISVHYSGTVAAVIEGAFSNLPGIAISLYSYKDKKFKEAGKFIYDYLNKHIAMIMKRKQTLNINIPLDVDYNKLPKYCKQGASNFSADYIPYELRGRTYYWAGGPEKIIDENNNDDDTEILKNEITIVPLKTDLTNYDELQQLKEEKRIIL